MQQIHKLSSTIFKSEFEGNFSNLKLSKTKMPHDNNSMNKTKGTFKEIKLDWVNMNNSTNSNWKNQSSRNWKNSTQTQWKTAKNTVVIDMKKKIDTSKEKIEEIITQDQACLDSYLGKGYIALSLKDINNAAFEGSEPPKMDELELQYLEVCNKSKIQQDDFEINESDEDKYSESNTHSQFNQNSREDKKRRVSSKKQKRDLSVDMENTILMGDAKIKQKIIDKYSKNTKQKIQKQTYSILITDKKFIDTSKSEYNNSLDQTRLPAASPTYRSQNIVTPTYIDNVKPTQCLSQSPQRSFSNKNSIETFKLPQTNSSKQQQQVKQYEDNKNIETHIAFRNSFYSNSKYQEQLTNQGGIKKKIPLIKAKNKNQQDDDVNEKTWNSTALGKMSLHRDSAVKRDLIEKDINSERIRHRNHMGSSGSNEI